MLKDNLPGSRPSSIVKLAVIATFVSLSLIFGWHSLRPTVYSQATPSVSRVAPADIEVGKDCKQCHSEVVDSFATQPHGKSAKFLTDWRAASCQTCHTNSAEHAKNSSRTKSGADPGNLAKLSASAINSSCMQCHSQDRHTFAWQGGKHDRKDVSCLSCHSQHHSKSEQKMLTAATTEETCLRCHTQVRKAVYQRSSHLIRTEQGHMKVGCASCHNPHGGEGDKMLLEATANNTCYSCHAEKRGPFLWDHPPVRENCMNCHSPHGSSNIRLLTQRANLQCQQCHIHMLPRHSTAAGKPLDIWTLNRGCVNCHSQVHGSNHPSGRTLTR